MKFLDNEFGVCNLKKPCGDKCICKDSPCIIIFPVKMVSVCGS